MILIIPEKPDLERDSVARVWRESGGDVLRLGKFWNPPELDPTRVRVYGDDIFCQVLAQKLDLSLVSPGDDFLGHVHKRWLGRDVDIFSLAMARESEFPVFLKSAAPKIFRACVYNDREELNKNCVKLPDDTLTIRSSIVSFMAEARGFILDGVVVDCSIYEGSESLSEATSFLESFVKENEIPKTVVLDIGYIENTGWAIIEANASWGSGLNGCAAEKVLPCILNAVESRVQQIAARDNPVS